MQTKQRETPHTTNMQSAFGLWKSERFWRFHLEILLTNRWKSVFTIK